MAETINREVIEGETSTPQIAWTAQQPSAFERSAVRAISHIPGLRGLVPSGRVITAMRGSTWTMVGYSASQVLKLASTLILARMLVPQAFGLVALVNVFLSGLDMLSDLGIGMDVVQHPRGDEPLFINTAFLIQALRGGILFVVATAVAYPFANFYHQPAVFKLLLVGSTSVLLRGMVSGSLWGMTRHLQLARYNLLNTASDLFGFLVSLAWAFFSRTAWPLVGGRVAATLALVTASHWLSEQSISIKWDKQAARDILTFGSGIIVGTATFFLCGEAERLVVAKFITLVELGCFSLALSVSSAASGGLQQIVSQVFFPMMARSLREDRQRAIEHFKRVRHFLSFGTGILAVGFIIGSHWFVAHVLGPKYALATPMLRLLGVRGALDLFIAVSVSMLFALGISRYGATGNALKLITLAVGLTLAFRSFGFHSALWVLTVAPLATYVVFLFGLKRHCNEVLWTELISFGGFAIMIALSLLCVHMFPQLDGH